MRIKFRLTLNANREHVTEIYIVESSGKLELVTSVKGWPGIDFNVDNDINSNTKLIG